MSESRADDFVPQPRVALRYAIGAIVFAIVAIFAGAWAIVPGWIALALLIMAITYMWLGPRVYAKRNGRIPWWVRVLLWPHVLGLFVFRQWQFRRMNHACDRIGGGVVLGRLLTDREACVLIASHSITAVVDVCAEHAETPAFRGLDYHNTAVLDLAAPTSRQLHEAAQFIARHAESGCVYVHCGLGKSRSAAVVAAYLFLHGKAGSADEACATVQQERSAAKFTPALRASLRALENDQQPAAARREIEAVASAAPAASQAGSART